MCELGWDENSKGEEDEMHYYP